jgi:hypothetical protein
MFSIKVLVPARVARTFNDASLGIERSTNTVLSSSDNVEDVFPWTDSRVIKISGDESNVAEAAVKIMNVCWQNDRTKFQVAIPTHAGHGCRFATAAQPNDITC